MSGVIIVNSGDTHWCGDGKPHDTHPWNYGPSHLPVIVRCEGVTVRRLNPMFRRIVLERHVDVSGVSGTGVVAYGVVFPDGSVVLRWDTKVNSTVHYDSLEDLVTITGHGGNTEVRYIDSVDHYITYYVEDDETRWTIEHSDSCRLSRQMATCIYTVWAREQANHDFWLPEQPARWLITWDSLHDRPVLEPA